MKPSINEKEIQKKEISELPTKIHKQVEKLMIQEDLPKISRGRKFVDISNEAKKNMNKPITTRSNRTLTAFGIPRNQG